MLVIMCHRLTVIDFIAAPCGALVAESLSLSQMRVIIGCLEAFIVAHHR